MSKGSNTLNQQTAKPSRSVLFGAAFLMATSAIGPGFLTQTSKFTAQFGTALSLVIVLAIIIKRAVQQKKNPYKNEIFSDTRDFRQAMARAE